MVMLLNSYSVVNMTWETGKKDTVNLTIAVVRYDLDRAECDNDDCQMWNDEW